MDFNTKKQTSATPPALICLGDISPKNVEFLWEPYLPLGKLIAFTGDPGVGKSRITTYIAAQISTGRPFFSSTEPKREPGNVVFMTTEDDADDTIVPRLDSFGADRTRIFHCDQPIDFGNGGIKIVETYLADKTPLLLVIDPIQVYTPGKDTNRANETRSFMAPLASLARKYKCVVLIIMHQNKMEGGKALYRALGSIDFIGACRSAITAAELPDGRRAIIHFKANNTPLGVSLTYLIVDGNLILSEAPDVTAKTLAGACDLNSRVTKLEEAEDFVSESLASQDPILASTLEVQAQERGISERTLKRALKSLNVKAVRRGGAWYKTLKEAGQDENE